MYVNGAQVGGNYADNNDYLYAALYIGQDFNGANHWDGHIDNLLLRRVLVIIQLDLQAPTQVDYNNADIVFGLDGEAPFILSTTELYAEYSGSEIFFCCC